VDEDEAAVVIDNDVIVAIKARWSWSRARDATMANENSFRALHGTKKISEPRFDLLTHAKKKLRFYYRIEDER
jgi:hypothetical protein